jgi:hypothetical protein
MSDETHTNTKIVGLTRDQANAICNALFHADFSKKIHATADLLQGDVGTGLYSVAIGPPLTLSEEVLRTRIHQAFQEALKRAPNKNEFHIRPRAVNFNESQRGEFPRSR